MRIHASLAVALAFSAALSAQSPLTTLFASNNSGSAGGINLFDLQVNTQVTINQIDVNVITGASLAATLDIYTCPTSYVGNETNSGAWTLVSSGNAFTTAANNTPSPCILATPFTLPPGTYGIQLKASANFGFAYTNGNGTATPGSGSNQTYSTAELTLRAGAAENVQYTAPFTPRVCNCNIYYSAGANFATKQPYGTGCYNLARSFYENFATASAFDLANSSLSMIYNGSNGYLVLPGIATFHTPGAGATTVAVGDDVEQTVTLGSALSFPGGSTSSLDICSNGYVSAAVGNGVGFTPSNTAFIAFPQACWALGWHDFNNSIAGSGPLQFEEVGSISYVTFNGCWDFGGTSASNASTMQIQFDRSSGNVHMIWQGMSTLGNGFLVGFKAAGAVLDPGNRDISVTLPATFQAGRDVLPLALDASARPVIGTTINLVTTNFPANSSVGASILSFIQHNPGLDLTSIGMPGCSQYVGLDSSVVVLPSGGTASRSLAIPNNQSLAGLHVYSQSAAFSAGANPLGVISSNGLNLGVNLN